MVDWITQLILRFLGIEDLSGLGEFLIKELDLKKLLDQIGKAIEEGDLKRAAELLGELLERLGKALKSGPLWGKIERKFGKSFVQALAKGLKKAIGRLVPFIGWALLVVAIIDAVDYANRHAKKTT